MSCACRTLLCLLVWIVTLPAFAQDEVALAGLDCHYMADKGRLRESVVISSLPATADSVAKPDVMSFDSGTPNEQAKLFRLQPGEMAECGFPSGHKVRVKVGEGVARPYGMCGGNPEVFMSVWVDERKLESRLWFAHHCYEDNRENPVIRLQFSGNGNQWSGRKCEARWPDAQGDPWPENPDPNAKLNYRCTRYDLSRPKRDTVEYPPNGARPPIAGSVEQLAGNAPVCDYVRQRLIEDFDLFSNETAEKPRLDYPVWTDTREDPPDLPKALSWATESEFDLNNDGKIDRVFQRRVQNNYQDSTLLLVQFGKSANSLVVDAPLISQGSRLLPCQLDEKLTDIRRCPPLAENADDPMVTFGAGAGRKPVQLTGRYMHVLPFRFERRTWLGVADLFPSNYVAVFEPLPTRKFRQTCLFRRVPENF